MLQLLKSLEEEGDAVEKEASPRAVVMVPTRELGDQISKVFKMLTHDTRLRVRPAFGGMKLEKTRKNVSGAFEIMLATPGRIVQMLDRNLIDLSDVRMLVFDEADQMMDQGFLADSKMIAAACPRDVQLALFSATISSTVQELMGGLFSSAEFIRSQKSGKVVPSLVTKNLIVESGKRWPLLDELLKAKIEGGTIIFTNTREQCDQLAQEIVEKGYLCAVYRGEMDKTQRRNNLRKFRSGEVDLLVATDLAGRGLDIPSVSRVINYHLPKQMDNYLHRVGRTARAGRKGVVFNLVTERDERLMVQLGTGYQPRKVARPEADKRKAPPRKKAKIASPKKSDSPRKSEVPKKPDSTKKKTAPRRFFKK
jgi:superfamily II DNA/RNA helicase